MHANKLNMLRSGSLFLASDSHFQLDEITEAYHPSQSKRVVTKHRELMAEGIALVVVTLSWSVCSL